MYNLQSQSINTGRTLRNIISNGDPVCHSWPQEIILSFPYEV
jgi:hypothetical protein